MKNYLLITFKSTHLALNMEKILKQEGILSKIIPVPRQISASCGLACRVLMDDYNKLIKVINNKNDEFEGIYSKKNSEYIEIEKP